MSKEENRSKEAKVREAVEARAREFLEARFSYLAFREHMIQPLADFSLAEVVKLREAIKAAQSILWMAKEYAEGGGSNSIEMRDYTEAAEQIESALNPGAAKEGL